MRPWYAFYPSDYERDTKLLTPMADLVYRRLLDFYWQNQAPIPLNYPAIARAIRLDTRVVKRYLQGELSRYWLTSDACISNPRMDAEIEKSNEIHKVRVKAGKHGGLAKAKANAIAKALAPQPQPLPQEQKEKKPSVSQRKTNGKFKPPSLQEVKDYVTEKGYPIDPDKFFHHYASANWYRGKTKITNWKLCVGTWLKNGDKNQQYGYGL